MAYAAVEQEKKKIKLINEDVIQAEKESQHLDASLMRERERQFHLMQTLHAMELHNKETSALLDQNRNDIRGLESATSAEAQRADEKLKVMLTRHVGGGLVII